MVSAPGEQFGVSGTRCFVCTPDRKQCACGPLLVAQDWRVCPVQSLTSSTYSANCQTFRHAESHELFPECFRNREFVQNFGKLQIQRHGGARGGRWANRKHFKCEMQSLIKLEACARDMCAGRCDVTDTERSPQTLPQTQKTFQNSSTENCVPNCYPHGTPWQQQGDRHRRKNKRRHNMLRQGSKHGNYNTMTMITRSDISLYT